MISLLLNPAEHYLLGIGRRHVVDAFEHTCQFLHYAGSVGAPALPHILFSVFFRSLEKEITLLPKVTDKIGTTLDHTGGAPYVFRCESGYAPALQFGGEKFRKTFVGELHQVFVIEPQSFLIVELGSGLGTMFKREFVNKRRHIHQLHIVTGIPAQQGKEIHDSLRQITTFAVSRRHFARSRVMPFERKYRKTEFIAVTF